MIAVLHACTTRSVPALKRLLDVLLNMKRQDVFTNAPTPMRF